MNADEYFETIPEERRTPLLKLREMILEAFPDIQEGMEYRMPTYMLYGQTLCALANQKNYMALYIMPYDLLDNFTEDLQKFNCGKSCIRFKKLTSDDTAMLAEVVRYAGVHYEQSIYYGKMNAKS